jgi:hypothetical protein
MIKSNLAMKEIDWASVKFESSAHDTNEVVRILDPRTNTFSGRTRRKLDKARHAKKLWHQ